MFYDRKDTYAMDQFEKATAQSDEQVLRAVGVSKETLYELLRQRSAEFN